MNYEGQPVLTAQEAALVALPQDVNHIVGTTRTVLTKPAGAKVLTLICEVDLFRVKVGDNTALAAPASSLSTTAPGATVSDGTGSVKLVAGQTLRIPAPNEITVVGSAAGSILTYYWS